MRQQFAWYITPESQRAKTVPNCGSLASNGDEQTTPELEDSGLYESAFSVELQLFWVPKAKNAAASPCCVSLRPGALRHDI
jgi:hypothetical protein